MQRSHAADLTEVEVHHIGAVDSYQLRGAIRGYRRIRRRVDGGVEHARRGVRQRIEPLHKFRTHHLLDAGRAGQEGGEAGCEGDEFGQTFALPTQRGAVEVAA